MRVRRLHPHGGATRRLERVRLPGAMEAVAGEVAEEGEEAESVSCADRMATGRAVWYHLMRLKLYIPDVSALACPNGGSKRQKSFGESRGGGGGGGGSSGACFKCGQEGHFSNGTLYQPLCCLMTESCFSLSQWRAPRRGRRFGIWKRVLQVREARAFQ